MGSEFPSLKGRQLFRLLTAQLGYEVVRSGKGSGRQLRAPGRGDVTFHYHDSRSLAPQEVRRVLVLQVGLSREDALEVARRG